MTGTRRLLVVGTAESTLQYALSEAGDASIAFEGPIEVVVLVQPDDETGVEERLTTMAVPSDVSIRTVLADDLSTVVRNLAETAAEILVDPSMLPLEEVRAAVETPVEVVPTGRGIRRRRLRHRMTPRRFLGTFLVSYAFYLLLGNPFDPFDVVTGAAAAGVVAVTLSPIVFQTEPTLGVSLPRIARATLFVPYLLYEIVRANVAIAAVILAPSLPIEPATVSFQPAVEDEFGRAVLANAITLTPGTLTVDVDEEQFLVHSLTPASRATLAGGALERAVRFVFDGRQS